MEDHKIIELFFDRSEKAITATARKYGKLCRSIALRIVGNYQDAEECENDTYEAAWNAIPPTRPEYFSAYLGRLTRNIALDRYAYNTAAKRNQEFSVVLGELEDCLPAVENVESEYEAGWVAGIISDFLRTIDSESRIAFLRRYWYGDSLKEISKKLGGSEGKIKSELYRTRQKLKGYLEERGVDI